MERSLVVREMHAPDGSHQVTLFADDLAELGVSADESTCSAAIDLATRGVHVFPLVGKKPDGGLTAHGVKNATDDIRTIVRWFWQHPERNLGIAIGVGALLGVRVLDTDPRNGGQQDLAKLEAEHGPLPETLTIESGRRDGGTHRYFLVPPGNYRGKISPGLDWLGRGRYVVAPPSIHPEAGQRYRTISAPDVGIRHAPAWLVRLARIEPSKAARVELPASTPVIERARRYLAKCEPAISGAHGHDQTFVVAMKLTRGFGLSAHDAYALLASDYNPRCKPAWSTRELRRKVNQTAEHGRMHFGALASAGRRT